MCVNCQQPHTANYRKCEAYQKYVQNKQRRGKNRVFQGRNETAYYNRRLNNEDNRIKTKESDAISITDETQVLLNHKNTNNNTSTKSYAEVVKNKVNTNKNNNTFIESTKNRITHNISCFDLIEKEIKGLFGLDMATFTMKITNFLPKYLNEANNINKKMMLLNFIIEINVFSEETSNHE